MASDAHVLTFVEYSMSANAFELLRMIMVAESKHAVSVSSRSELSAPDIFKRISYTFFIISKADLGRE
jgi:hypothetical protein